MTDFHQLYERYAPDVYRFVFWLTGSVEEAEDVTSETFLRAWTSGDLRVETVKAYLLAVARNPVRQRWRGESRRAELAGERVDDAPGPDRMVEGRDELEHVLRQLAALPESTQAALVMHAVEVKVRIHRARMRLAAARGDRELSVP